MDNHLSTDPDGEFQSLPGYTDFTCWTLTSIENAIDNVEMAGFFLRSIPTDWRWKWCIIATHQALYGFLICALQGTAPILTVTERNISEFPSVGQNHIIGACHAWQANGLSNAEITDKLIALIAANPKKKNSGYVVKESTVEKWLKERPKLIGIKEALARMCATQPNTGEPFNEDRNDYLPWLDSRRLVLSGSEKQAIDNLIWKFRNEFEHFIPTSWDINTALFPSMLIHVFRAIRFIALESNCIGFDEEQLERIIKALDDIQAELDAAIS